MRLKYCLFTIILIFYLTTIIHMASCDENNFGEPLFLTPLIHSGDIEEARKLAVVHQLSSSVTVTSYSGLITVDKDNGVHNFFWFFPAANKPEGAPVLLWSDGGPGASALFSAFTLNGPFYIGEEGEQDLKLRENRWTQNYSVIFFDQPMDVGYSFMEKEEGRVSSASECAPNVYKFLMQFFTMFPEFQHNDFYNCGGSYGGKYATTFAHFIHTKNLENPEIKINLKGVFMDSPWFDPVSQINYGEHLYHAGLIDDNAKLHFEKQAGIMKNLISQGKYSEAQQINLDLLWGSPDGTFYANVTGLGTFYNIIQDQFDIARMMKFVPFVQSEKFRSAAHVGNLSFEVSSKLVQELFKSSVLKSVKPLLEELLDQDYKVLVCSPQLDIITSHVGIDTAIRSLNWKEADAFSKAARDVWKINGTVVGYIKRVKNLTQVLVRNSGHGVVIDKPELLLQLLDGFANKSLPDEELCTRTGATTSNTNEDTCDGSGSSATPEIHTKSQDEL